MKIRSYCIVVMGNTQNCSDELRKIANAEPNILDAKGIVIATFISELSVKYLTKKFKELGRNFLLFELDPNSSGFNITKKDVNDGLFGFLKMLPSWIVDDSIELSSTTTDYVSSGRTSRRVPIGRKPLQSVSISPEDIAKMCQKEKDALFNKLIDMGVEKLTEYDKELLQILSK